MEKLEFINKIKELVKDVWSKKVKSDDVLPYDSLTNFPELKKIIVDLLTTDFDKFLESIDWVAPRPTTFRINLLNGKDFTLIYGERSWTAKIEGKKYNLINLNEEQRAAKAIARILSYGAEEKRPGDDEDPNFEGGDSGGESSSGGSSGSGGLSRSEYDASLEDEIDDEEIEI